MKWGRQSTTTPPAGRQGDQAVTKATRYPEGGTSEKTGPGRHKGPTVGGREASIGRGGEPTTAIQTTEKRRPNHPQKGARRPRTDAHSRAGRNTDTTQSQPKRGHAREKAKHKTKDNGRQGEHSPDQDRTEPTHQTKQKGGPRGDRTPRRHAKGSPPHRSKWEQTAMWRPRKEGTGDKMAKWQQNRGKRRRKGRVATSNSV